MQESNELCFSIAPSLSNHFTATVTVPASLVARLYQEASGMQQENTHTHGFSRGATPLQHIKSTYKTHITEHLKEFLYQYLVRTFLHQELRATKFLFSGEPRLVDARVETEENSVFTFELTVPQTLTLRGWKYYSFKQPRRKNYRDLDRQVEAFMKAEEHLTASPQTNAVGVNDWVCFDVSLVDKQQQLLHPLLQQNFWLKMGSEEVDAPFRDLFCGKHIDEHFYSSSSCLQEYFSTHLDTTYLFHITIRDIASDALFSFEEFKAHFRLRTNKEMHKKFIEVFSYRNDLSQRRETIEEAFDLLFKQHPVEVPQYLIIRRQQTLLKTMQENPDYHVYRMQPDFESRIQQLAEKQMRELILIDQIALCENIAVSHQDIKQYLNLLKRPRTKEFLYFEMPVTRTHLNALEVPIATEMLKRYCLREKALNYLVYHLTKK